MAHFEIEQPGVPKMNVVLQKDEQSFGRSADNDVVLVAEEVSRHHAKVFVHGQTVLVKDLESLNGTYVNRQRVVERVLSDGDEVWLGAKCRMLFKVDTADVPPPEPEPELPSADDTALQKDLDAIRARMDRAANNLTLMGQRGAPGQEALAEEASKEDLIDMSRAYRRLEALYRATKVIASEFDLQKRLSDVLDTAIEVFNAERGYIMLREEGGDAIHVSVARGIGKGLDSGSVPSMGIARRAAIDGKPVLMEDAESDRQFGMRESIIRQNIVSAMCVPLKIEDRMMGSIYVDTRTVTAGFDEADLEMFASMASQSAMAIDNVRLYEQMLAAERKRANLGRFLSPAIVEEIMKEDSQLELGGRKRMVTTMFCDIRGFTPMTERLDATEIVALLNEHFTAMTEIVFEHQGTLDKYIGDELMGVFGAPISSADDAQRGVMAALAIQARNTELNDLRAKEGRPCIELGIGIDTGEVVAGYIGSPMRMEFTVVGDHVNTARRLCGLAGAGEVVIGEQTFATCQDLVQAEDIGAVDLKGKKNLVQAYRVQARDEVQLRETKPYSGQHDTPPSQV